MRTPAVALAIVALIVVGCGSPPAASSPSPGNAATASASPQDGASVPSGATGSPTAEPSAPDDVTPVPTDASGLPEAVANRPELPSCGSERANRQDGPWNAAARVCFWQAYKGGQPAEFTSTRLTMEGDPITTIYRALGDGRVELFIDSTQDRWGSGAWEHAVCTTLAALTDGVVEPDFAPDESCELTPLD